MRWLGPAGFVLMLGVGVGCDGGTPLERGTRIFQRSCSPCHGADGRRGAAALGFNPPPRDFSDSDFQLRTTDEQLRRSIRLGKGQMPAFGGILADEDVSAAIVFIRSLGPPELRPAPLPGASASGQAGTAPPGVAGTPQPSAPSSGGG